MGSAPPPARPREIVLRLDAGERGWRKRLGGTGAGAPSDSIRLVGSEIVFSHAGVLQAPLTIPAGLVAVATVDRGKPGAGEEARFPILHRMSAAATAVIPFEEGVEGWLCTADAGSALPALGDAVPNLALVFVKPLDEGLVEERFRPAAVSALAERSPLGVPAVAGLLARVAEPTLAEEAFAELGVDRPLTDREVAPAQRRHLPSARPANPTIGFSETGRRRTSIPPPPPPR